MAALNTLLAKNHRDKIPTESNVFTSFGPHMYVGIQVTAVLLASISNVLFKMEYKYWSIFIFHAVSCV